MSTKGLFLVSADVPEKRRWMGFQARERVEKNFSWESIAWQTFKFYRELTEGRKNYSSNVPF